MNVKLNLYPLIKDVEKKRGTDFQQQELADEIGISRQSLTRLLTSQSQRIDYDTLGKLVVFFDNYDIPINLGTLFHVSRTADEGSDDG